MVAQHLRTLIKVVKPEGIDQTFHLFLGHGAAIVEPRRSAGVVRGQIALKNPLIH